MNSHSLDAGFEKYRRGRQRRRMESGQPLRPLGDNAEVLAQLERAEAAEVMDQRLTREVHEFFSDATKTAASIVQRVAAQAEAQSGARISSEMQAFLVETLKRMEHFVQSIKKTGKGVGETNLETDMHALVGPMLDAFRVEGTAQLADKHLGQDPFADELGQIAPDSAEEARAARAAAIEDAADADPWAAITGASTDAPEVEQPAESDNELEGVLADRLGADAAPPPPPQPEPAPAPRARPVEKAPSPSADGDRADHFLLAGLGEDPERMREALRVLVKNGFMNRDEALGVYRQALMGR